ncbi:MAG TPA: VWA domain-containing protein [Bryobacteraceae bacterium]|nr:VWA domain-containing protein [Bryobacteraceae bacterium]
MKALSVIATALVCGLGLTMFLEAQGPGPSGSETVGRRKGTSNAGSNTPAAGTPAAEPDQPKIPSKFSKKDGDLPEGVPTFSTDAITVTVDTAVLDNRGHFIPKIPKSYFRVVEDNVPQQVTGYSIGEAPMTIALVVEFSARFQSFYSYTWYQTLQAAYGFLGTLKPDDYLAVVAYDLRPEILSDFSTNRQDAQEAMSRLRIPGFSEANLYDALTFTADRMQDIEGRKAIVLLSSGIDTFSKQNFDQARRALQNDGIPIYSIGLMQAMRNMMEARGGLSGSAELDFLQADNQMRTFAKETGGMSFFPKFEGEMPGIFQLIEEGMRNQYVLSYTPSNQSRDGKFRKIKVELIDPNTNQVAIIKDEKNKPVKYQVVAKTGYKAPRPVE